MVELLAPAGDLEKLKIALLYGADAVYIGGRDYSLRANAKNFNLKELKEACLFAHKLNKKVYVTINIVFHDKDIKNLDKYLNDLKNIKVDALIISDIFVVKMAVEKGFYVILSTQTSPMNYETVNFWKKLGIKRIVLARELNREDIIAIKDKTKISMEAFIHGAMCTSISGKCVLSNYITNRDANRGGCAQICRWAFNNDNKPKFTFMSKDLIMIDYLDDMINIGIDSFKIEGRMRSIYYIATVVNCYRKIIDGILNKTITDNDKIYYQKILNRVANRETIPQFYNKFPSFNESYFLEQEELSNQDFLGIVVGYDAYTKTVVLEQRNYFKKGDIVEFIGPNIEPFTYIIDSIYNEKNEIINIANHPQMIVKLNIKKRLSKNSIMRIKLFDKQCKL